MKRSAMRRASMMCRMYCELLPLPVPDVIELLELPMEFGALPQRPSSLEEAARTSAVLATKRRQQLQVIELENPSTTTFALFL
jgi:hypothetical protein